MSLPAPVLDFYLQLASPGITADRLCDHPVTRRYATRFSLLEVALGPTDARAWLLGALLLDHHHPESDPPAPSSPPHPQAPLPLWPLDPTHTKPLPLNPHPHPPETA